MRRRKSPGLSLSILDVLSCALGASVILAVIFSLIKDPPSAPKVGQFIFTRATIKGNVITGFEVTRPSGEKSHVYPGIELDKMFYWLVETNETFTHVYLRIVDPEVGTWNIRPYGVTQKRLDRAPGDLKLTGMTVWTLNKIIELDEPIAKSQPNLDSPADYFNMKQVNVPIE